MSTDCHLVVMRRVGAIPVWTVPTVPGTRRKSAQVSRAASLLMACLDELLCYSLTSCHFTTSHINVHTKRCMTSDAVFIPFLK